MIDFVAIVSRLAYICSGGGQNGCAARIVAVCAVLAALAGVVGGGWAGVAYADGGEDAREQAAVSAEDESGDVIQSYTRRILRALADDDANKWVRYWRARADCDAARAAYGQDNGDGARMERVLLGLTGMVCARLDARLGVNPGDYLPREGEERTLGLVASEAGAAVGYTLFTGRWNHDVFLLDPLGAVVYVWHMDTSYTHPKLLDNGNLLAIRQNGIFEFDPRGNLVWRYRINRLHHDHIRMPNGNALLLANKNKTREEVIAAGANPDFVHKDGLRLDYLAEVRLKARAEVKSSWNGRHGIIWSKTLTLPSQTTAQSPITPSS